jgi:hypothetical protein
MSAKAIYEKYCKGDSLTNKEVRDGLVAFKAAYEATSGFGDVYRLVATDALMKMQAFEGFARARGILTEQS